MNRKLTREEAVKVLYTMDIRNSYDMQICEDYIEHCGNIELDDDDLEFKSFNSRQIDMEYLNKTVSDIINNLENIDSIIADNSKGWKLNRIAKVDLAILRVAVAEIVYNPLIPESVSINEAVELSKKYSIDESHKFINGVLGSVYRGLMQ
ncbi:transcription antitermination factor NusB [Sedimentibacter sp. zth1]|uniref:transcription antitermination factor NusB n=1 Tax=Sedimentibacter sp. zth1 TaxID=2816908 RepID=UPI001A923DA2|nr:transcription antitermination factor NusB [Sedimentibacter sp. zth1]QSX06817.1 transcription antitermination factor NusB [Sedimentibacter sp. zth1]